MGLAPPSTPRKSKASPVIVTTDDAVVPEVILAAPMAAPPAPPAGVPGGAAFYYVPRDHILKSVRKYHGLPGEDVRCFRREINAAIIPVNWPAAAPGVQV